MAGEPLTVDPIASYARRDGDSIRLVLTVARDLKGGPAWVRFVGPGSASRSEARVTQVGDASRVDVTLPAAQLSAGTWRLLLRERGGARPRSLRTRLLVSDTQPIALLPGSPPKTLMTDHTG